MLLRAGFIGPCRRVVTRVVGEPQICRAHAMPPAACCCKPPCHRIQSRCKTGGMSLCLAITEDGIPRLLLFGVCDSFRRLLTLVAASVRHEMMRNVCSAGIQIMSHHERVALGCPDLKNSRTPGGTERSCPWQTSSSMQLAHGRGNGAHRQGNGAHGQGNGAHGRGNGGTRPAIFD